MILGSNFVFLAVAITLCGLPYDDVFHPGMVIKEFGKIADVESDVDIPAATVFKVRFDVANKSESKSMNRSFNSVARFINLHVAAGVPRNNIKIAIIVHGSAALDVTKDSFYEQKNEDQKNASTEAVSILLENNVEFYLCGQTAAYHRIKKDDLLKGVKVAHSAMTIHALLDQQGYSLNPF